MLVNNVHYFNNPQAIHEAYENGLITYHTEVKYKFRDTTEWVDITYGRFLIWEFTGYLPEGALSKKGVKNLVIHINREYSPEVAVKKMKQLQDLAFKIATEKGITLGMDDFHPMPGTNEIMAEEQVRISALPIEERAEEWDTVINGQVDRWINEVDRNNPLYAMYQSGARVTPSQIRQMVVGKGLLTKMNGEINPDAVTQSLATGLSVYNYFMTCGPARRGLANNFFVVPASGYFARQLVNAARDLTIVEEDCGTREGVEVKSKYAVGRYLAGTSELWTKDSKTDMPYLKVRSPLTCSSVLGGLCAKCCGQDPATNEDWRVGFGMGTASAQHISEPATQAGLRGKHTSGSVTLADYRNSVDNVLPNIIRAFGGIGTQFVTTEGATSKTLYDFSKTEKDPITAAEKLCQHIKDLFVEGGLGVASIHIEVIIRSCIEQVIKKDGEVGLRSHGDEGRIKCLNVSQVPLNYPSWLKSISFGYTSSRLRKAVCRMEKTYGVMTEQIMTTAFQH
jgi:hypothetical protein